MDLANDDRFEGLSLLEHLKHGVDRDLVTLRQVHAQHSVFSDDHKQRQIDCIRPYKLCDTGGLRDTIHSNIIRFFLEQNSSVLFSLFRHLLAGYSSEVHAGLHFPESPANSKNQLLEDNPEHPRISEVMEPFGSQIRPQCLGLRQRLSVAGESGTIKIFLRLYVWNY